MLLPDYYIIMKKYFVSLSVVFSAFTPVFAALAAAPGSQLINFTQNLLETANILVTLMFVIALLVFAFGIIRFLLAAGDPNAVSSAKGYILWGVVGMAVLASLFGLILFLRNFFGISGDAGTIKVPDIVGPGQL